MSDELKAMAESVGAPYWWVDDEYLRAFAALVEEQTITRCAVPVSAIADDCHRAQQEPPTHHGMLLEITLYDLAQRIRGLPRLFAPPSPTQEGT